jgi:two-component system OmpR family response regulator
VGSSMPASRSLINSRKIARMKALLAEDDARLSQQLDAAFREAGFVPTVAHDGIDIEHLGASEPFDVVVLDLGLPSKDGISILQSWRGQGVTTPVLILTARDEWAEKVSGFRAGADDYVVKPFRMEEVIVRARSLIRRAAGHAQSIIACGALEYDTQTTSFTLDGLPLKLTAFEAQILSYMIHHQDRAISRTELSEHVYDRDTDRDFNSMEVIIGRLRRKIGTDMIRTVRGRGYVLAASSESEAERA